jgi:hypothetical protein
MGIVTDPGYELWGVDNLCFTPGKTPKKLYVTVAGIQTGIIWTPADGIPMNGVWRIEQSNYYLWTTDPACGWIINLYLTITYSMLTMTRVPGAPQFTTIYEPPCTFSFTNAQQGGSGYFNYGVAAVTSRPITGVIPSIKEIAQNIGIEPAKKTFADLMIDEEKNRYIRLCRKQDKTRIILKLK